MLSCGPGAPVRGGMIFADCGLVIQPDARELAAIALSAADSRVPVFVIPTDEERMIASHTLAILARAAVQPPLAA